MIKYLVYDVFTDTPFGGNQLAVIPDATMLPEGDLQKIAKEFNFSETTFVYPPVHAAHTAKVRIFTPTMEVAFAGHPTIGSAVVLRDLGHVGNMVLELGIGPIPCHFAGNLASFTTSARLERLSTPAPDLIARALGLPESSINSKTHAPVQASLGLPFVIAELDSPESLATCAPNIDALREGANKHPAGFDFAIYVYLRCGSDIQARMFAPLDNIPEDPATGSAAATLAALLTEELNAPQNLRISQGAHIGRPSLMIATTKMLDPVPVTISGQARRVMEGNLVY